MNHDKVDALLAQSGCRFEFLHGKDYEDFSPYKFAELIIRECMDVVRDINQEYDGGSTVVNAADEIRDYFGFEE